MASGTPFDPFEALGLPRDATSAAIKSRYRELARRYHPNRHQGSEESKAALAEHFHCIHQAWGHLRAPEKRHRYAELLQLAEEQDELLARMADLLNQPDEQHPRVETHAAAGDGYVSSDAEEDELPRVQRHGTRTTLDRAMTGIEHLGDAPEETTAAVRWSALHKRHNHSATRFGPPIHAAAEPETGDYFSMRRKKLEKLRRREMAMFVSYRDAMVNKFEAQAEAERQKERYERAKWKRDYFERAPREMADRFRSFQHYIAAIRAFALPAPRRRNRSTGSHSSQILSTGDVSDNAGRYLDAENASQTRPDYRRGWSSDISGDQDSSDENGSGPPTPRLGFPMQWSHRRQSRNRSLEAFKLAVLPKVGDCSVSSVPNHGPFKMLVKRPTGLEDPLEVNDSSPDSASGTSRSPSPMANPRSIGAFIVIPSPHFAEFLGIGRSASPASSQTPGIKLKASNEHSPHSVRLSPDTDSFRIKVVRRPELQRVPFENVHLLTVKEKARILGTEPDSDADPDELLARLTRLGHEIADNFMIKPDIIGTFNFRLVYSHRQGVKAHHETFIALSYRRRIHVEKDYHSFTLPLDKDLFQAVWDERLSDSEGVWVDQISIDQDSDAERTISMSAMDMVYRSARLVVVVLDDIELNAHEGEILENHMEEFARMSHVSPTKRFRRKQPPYLETHDELYQVLRKLLRSSWFRRAWCRHEMRLARDHVFLVPCRSPGTWSGMSILRFTGQCLTHLLALATEVPFEESIEVLKPALHAFFRDRSKLPPHERHLHSHHGNFTTVIAEVFAMETGGDPRIPALQRAADALKDKIAIILNTMECGLALAPKIKDPQTILSKSDCQYMMMLLALAAQDPGALTSVGPPMRLNSSEAATPNVSSTWLFEPTNVDAGLNNYRTLNRLAADAVINNHTEFDEHYVRLELKFLHPGKVVHGIDSDNLELAKKIVSFCDRRKLGRNRKRYLVADVAAKRHFGLMHEVYVQTLACVLDGGPDWMEDVCHRYGVARANQDLQSAYELAIAFKNTAGRWPEHAWSERAGGFLMDLVNFFIIRGLPQRQILHCEKWRPILVTTEGGGRVLTFVPPGNIESAVPTALLDPDYLHLARLWILEPRESQADGPGQADWTLLGKSVLFSDGAAMRRVHSLDGVRIDHHNVYGREDPQIQRLLRERSLHV